MLLVKRKHKNRYFELDGFCAPKARDELQDVGRGGIRIKQMHLGHLDLHHEHHHHHFLHHHHQHHHHLSHHPHPHHHHHHHFNHHTIVLIMFLCSDFSWNIITINITLAFLVLPIDIINSDDHHCYCSNHHHHHCKSLASSSLPSLKSSSWASENVKPLHKIVWTSMMKLKVNVPYMSPYNIWQPTSILHGRNCKKLFASYYES